MSSAILFVNSKSSASRTTLLKVLRVLIFIMRVSGLMLFLDGLC